jgi:hypothetical protein
VNTKSIRRTIILIGAISPISLAAAVHYVDVNSTNAVAPYTNWATAANAIQDAVDVALPGEEVVVTNGVYDTGGYAIYEELQNRIAVTKAITVRSVNGPDVTIIRGYQVPGTTNGDGAIRCVYLTNGATLAGFTLTNGATRSLTTSGTGILFAERGGGAWCESTSAVLSNCVLIGNSAPPMRLFRLCNDGSGEPMGEGDCESYTGGGGVFRGTLYDCKLISNSAAFGGGALRSVLKNCTLSGNYAAYGGGAYGGTLNNCTLTGNFGTVGGGAIGGTLNNCLLTGNSASFGGGAAFATLNNSTVTGNSAGGGGGVWWGALNNCIVYYNTADDAANHAGFLDGETGEMFSSCTTPLPINGVGNITNSPLFVDASSGNFRLQSNSPCINAGRNTDAPAGLDRDGNPRIAGGTVDMGAYEFQPTIHYVNVNSATPTPPYTNWATAANAIQDAVDVALPGEEIVVTNGVYESGGRIDELGGSNRVAVLKPLLIRSVQGPDVTVIRGFRPRFQSDGAPGVFSSEPIRCVYLTNGATLFGFTLTDGASRSEGGGIFSESTASVTECLITGNNVGYGGSGGGAFGGTLENCVISSNSATSGGGVSLATLKNCELRQNYADAEGWMTFGGGAINSILKNCSLSENFAAFGGGAANSILENCLVINNSASQDGGGVANFSTFAHLLFPELRNCTIAGNSAGRKGGGVWSISPGGRLLCEGAGPGPGPCIVAAKVNNCIVYGNNAPQAANQAGGQMFYSCTTPVPTNGFGNITNAPLFLEAAAGNFRLQSSSPCINAGLNTNAPTGLDRDGNPRIAGGTVDLGAYEIQLPASRLSYAWLLHYGFALDGSADFGDSDGDGYTNFQEWQRETNPIDQRSFPFRLTPSVHGPWLTWESVAGRLYTVERSTNTIGAPVFRPVAEDIIGQPGMTGWGWDSIITPPHALYRVRLVE